MNDYKELNMKITQKERDEWFKVKEQPKRPLFLLGAKNYELYIKDPKKYFDNLCTMIRNQIDKK